MVLVIASRLSIVNNIRSNFHFGDLLFTYLTTIFLLYSLLFKNRTPVPKSLFQISVKATISSRFHWITFWMMYFMKWNMPQQASLYSGKSRKEKPRGRHQALSQQKRQEIKEAFELFDTDGSGTERLVVICLCYVLNFLILLLLSFLIHLWDYVV